MGGLVSSGTKIQMAYNYMDEKHILPFNFYIKFMFLGVVHFHAIFFNQSLRY